MYDVVEHLNGQLIVSEITLKDTIAHLNCILNTTLKPNLIDIKFNGRTS